MKTHFLKKLLKKILYQKLNFKDLNLLFSFQMITNNAPAELIQLDPHQPIHHQVSIPIEQLHQIEHTNYILVPHVPGDHPLTEVTNVTIATSGSTTQSVIKTEQVC